MNTPNLTDTPHSTEEATEHRSNPVFRYFIGALCVLAILLFSISFTVKEGRESVVLRFGEPVRVAGNAGLHFKAPWPVERVREIDIRSRSISTPHTELLTRDRKNIVLMTGAAWRPSDPVLFYRAVPSLEDADEKVIGLLVNSTIAVFGRYDLSALVSTDKETLKISDIEQDLLRAVNEVSQSKYGIEIIHAGFKRVSLPEQNVIFVLEQMRAERRQFAEQFRADGKLQAAQIRSAADLEAARILADANARAARILGQAEADAAEIYAQAHNADPEFYRFIRSVESMGETLGENAIVMLRTDTAPFNLLTEPERTLQGSVSDTERTAAPIQGEIE
ncbi:MAG: protease modulator HflC [Pseudomonadota bacterium]